MSCYGFYGFYDSRLDLFGGLFVAFQEWNDALLDQ